LLFGRLLLGRIACRLHVGMVGSLCPSIGTTVLLVNTTNSSFGDLSFDNPALANTQFTAEPDDRVLEMWALGDGDN